jgi:predicted O-methyltransferase YrrM
MESDNQIPEYALGNTHAEHQRLLRQAERLNPITERLFREAGIGPGQRVLDIGSGAGDVAMLAARLVGSSGEVVGLERDVRSIHRARARVAAAGLYNVRSLSPTFRRSRAINNSMRRWAGLSCSFCLVPPTLCARFLA